MSYAKAARGGLGNRNFATARRQTPRFAQPGEPGTEGDYLLELRLIAEVGLVGYPNAGKSTLLTAISHARPKIAPYPFTTLHPQIGIVEYPDYHRLTVCDVPGLIEGAHKNVGLGHVFLRHIERCKILVLVLDMAGTDGRKPWDDYRQLLTELELYDSALVKRPRLVVANKMDEPTAEKNLKEFKRKVRKTRVLPMAAAFDEGVGNFKEAIREAVEAAEDQIAPVIRGGFRVVIIHFTRPAILLTCFRRIRLFMGAITYAGKKPKRFKWTKRIIIALALYTIIGCFVVPAVIKSQMLKRLPALTHRTATVEQVKFNPYALSLTIRGFTLTETNGEVFGSFDEFYVNFQPMASLFKRAWVFSDISLQKPYAQITYRPDGTFNFANLIPTSSPASNSPPPTPGMTATLPRLTIYNLEHLQRPHLLQ